VRSSHLSPIHPLEEFASRNPVEASAFLLDGLHEGMKSRIRDTVYVLEGVPPLAD
jgi:hypothetical protein